MTPLRTIGKPFIVMNRFTRLMGTIDYGKLGFVLALIMLILGTIQFGVSLYRDFDPIYYYIGLFFMVFSIGYLTGKFVYQSHDTRGNAGVVVPDSMKKSTRIEVCPVGPHLINEDYKEFLLNVQPGQHIKGYLEESDKLIFDYWIVDYDGFIDLKTDGHAEYEEWGDYEKYYKIDWNVPHTQKGPWYLVIDIQSKLDPRSVKISLQPVEG